MAWALGLLVFACVPFVSSLVASVAMMIAGRSIRRNAVGVGAENGRRAANWGATYLLLTLVLLGAHFAILFAAGEIEDFLPFGLIIITWGAVSIAHVVVCIVGLMRASNRRPMRVWAIPIFR